MKFLLIILFILSFIAIFGNYFAQFESGALITPINSTEENNLIITTPSPTENPSLPVIVDIPKIAISTIVEQVGTDEGGRMGVPVEAANVGWFNLGAKPGEKGNAVLAGHLDTITGAPAVFYNLNLLEIGDEIVITEDKGKVLKFKVFDKQIYQFDDFPVEQVFGESDRSRLNLITCEGIFDQRSQNYSHRTVIYSELIE